MRRVDAMAMAVKLMDEHGVWARGWRFAFDRATARAGCCHYGKRIVSLSGPIVDLWEEAEVRDTILHEIAHVIAGPQAGHGRAWKMAALQVGARPERTTAGPTPEPLWRGTCPAGHVVGRRRKATVRQSCGTCAPRVFDPAHLITWERTR